MPLLKKFTVRFRAVDKDSFDAVKVGKKKVETRTATQRYKNKKKGDILVFYCGGEKFEKKVKRAKIFSSISAILKNYKTKDIRPDLSTKEELRKM